MSAPIVSISGRPCQRRKNRAIDQEAICVRRLIDANEKLGCDEQNNVALAIALALQSKLPRNNLRLIAGTLDIRRDFDVRVADVAIARAECDLFHAKITRTRALHGDEAAKAMYPENDSLFERYRQAMLDMANTPVFTKADSRRKRSVIGET